MSPSIRVALLAPAVAIAFISLARAADEVPATSPTREVGAPPPAVPAAVAPVPAAADVPTPAPQAGDSGSEPVFVAKPFPSLFFWPGEVAEIRKAIDEHDHPPVADVGKDQGNGSLALSTQEKSRPHLPNVYVSAILDFGDGNWTVWANGLRVTPTQQSPLFKIVAVRGNSVDIVVPGANGGRFVLQPYQTWRSAQKDVVEGIVP